MIVDEKTTDSIAFVYTTCANREEARSITLASVNEKLAVCGDFWKVESIYPWDDNIEEAEQYTLMLTTQKSLAVKLSEFIKGMHSYNIPMIAVCDVALMNQSYKFWIERALRSITAQTPDINAAHVSPDEDGYTVGRLK